MEDIDNLPDDQLRRRLAQYGFANLPVTDTTRKVLIKKLKNAIGNESTKNRRETVAVSKFSSDEEPEKEDTAKARGAKTPNRRATVAVTEKSSVKKVNGTAAANGRAETPVKTPSRRTSRATPAKQDATVLQEESDEDVIEIPVRRRSTSRNSTATPTLGKSDTVRTSYKTTVDVVEEKDDEVQEIEVEVQPPRRPSPIITQSGSRRKTFTTSTSSFSTDLQEKTKFPEKSKFSIPSISNTYTRRQTYNYSQPEEDEQLELDETTTPYLSNFAKRLSTLRAEPLDAGMDKYKAMRETGTSSYQKPSYSYQSSQAAPVKRKSGMMKSLGQIFESLDRQYNFRTILYSIFIVMIIVAIYVLFFM